MAKSAWLDTSNEENDPFLELLSIYNAYLSDSTVNAARIRVKLNAVWSVLNIATKKHWTARLMAMKRLDVKTVQILEIFCGYISTFS